MILKEYFIYKVLYKYLSYLLKGSIKNYTLLKDQKRLLMEAKTKTVSNVLT